MDKEMIGLISGFIVNLSVIPYAIRVWQRKIAPNLTSWVLWSLIALVLLLTFDSSGAEANIWPAVFGFVNPLLITVILVSRRKRLTWPNKVEWTCVFFCFVSLAMWIYMKNDRQLVQYALYVGIVADAWAAIPTLFAYIKDPRLDRPFMWALFGVGYGLSIFAIEEHTFANYALPVYMLIGASSISAVLFVYRIRNSIPLKEWV